MALMKFREPNQVAWIGVRPAHRGAQVTARAQADNTTVIVHTVTSGKTFFWTHLSNMVFSSAAGGNMQLYVRDDSDVTQYFLYSGANRLAHHSNWSDAFWPPIEIPSLWDIVVLSNNSFVVYNAFVTGWEE